MAQDDIVIRIRTELIEAQKGLKDVQKKFKETSASITDVAKAQQNVANVTDRLNRSMGKVPFAGYAMSIMFFGAAMQRTFTSIAKTGLASFNDIAHSVEGTVTSSDMLDGSMKYLGYTIGEALQPVIEWLVPIVDKISEWAEENPKLTAGIVTLGVVLGTLFLVGGAGKLAYDGFAGLSSILSTLSSFKMGGWLGGLTLSAPVVLAIAALAAGILAFNKALDDSPAFKEDFKKSIIDPLTQSFKDLWSSINDIFVELFNGEGIVDTIGGMFLIVARIIVDVLAPALVLLAELWRSVFKTIKAAILAMKGDMSGANNALSGAFNFEGAYKTAKRSIEDMNKLLESLSSGNFTISGQMAAYKGADADMNIQQGAYSPAYVSPTQSIGLGQGPIVIQQMTVVSNNVEDLLFELQRRTLSGG